MQIANAIIIGIAEGKVAEGYQLPSVRSMASDLSVNMHTVNKAYKLLADQGYTIIKHKKGAIINNVEKLSAFDNSVELRLALAKYLLQKGDRDLVKSEIDCILNGFKEA